MPVRAVVSRGQLQTSGALDVLREALDEAETETVRGIRCTSVPRALFDELRRADIVQAVVAMDMASAAGLQSVVEQRTYTLARRRSRWAKTALRALWLARDGSASPNETRLRLVWSLLARLPEPLLNQPLFDADGNHLGTVDLFDPDVGLAAEFDGADHRTASRHAADVTREDRLRRAGVEVVRVVGPDLRRSREVADRLRAAHDRARELGRRSWTMEQPLWFLERHRFM